MFLFLAIISGSPYWSLYFILKASASYPIGCCGLYSPGPGFDRSAPTFSGLITTFVKASLPVPNEKVLGPFTCTAKVEVVLFGLKREGILYVLGGGDFDFPAKENKH